MPPNADARPCGTGAGRRAAGSGGAQPRVSDRLGSPGQLQRDRPGRGVTVRPLRRGGPWGQRPWATPSRERNWSGWPPPPSSPPYPATVGPNSTSPPTAPSNPAWRRRGAAAAAASPPSPASGSADDSPTLHGPLPPQPSSFTLGQPAPDPELLAVGQCVLEAVLAHHTAPADLLRLAGRCTPLGEEKVRVDTHAVGFGLPAAFLGPVHQ